jgi:hypothetical protein
MTPKTTVPAVIVLSLALLSCGGGGSDSGSATSPTPTQGVSGGVTTQEVEVFAPTVRGTWYTFDGPEVAVSPTATVLMDGVPVPVAGLSILEGEVAFVSGNVTFDADHNPGGLMTADRVELSHVVDGPVDSVDLVHSRLVVLGLTILVDGGSAITEAGSDLRSVQVGERVTVAGHATASDQVLATSINPSALTGDFVVTAFVTSVDPMQKQMTIGNLVVDYSSASLQGFAASDPNIGDRIRLRGRRGAGATNLTASSLSYLSPRLAGSPGSIAALHGLVTSISSASAVAVDGYTVALSTAALQSCGSPPALNAVVTLDGMLQANGEVIADVFCFDQPQGTGINVTGRVDAIDPVFGTLSILGFEVQPSITTRVTFGGKTASLSDIRVGDYVLGQGGGGLVDADILVSQLVRYTSPASTAIEAANGYYRFADPLVYVEGRPIGTDANTQFSFVGPDGNQTVQPMTRALFFSNPHYFPYWDKICRPTLRFSVSQNADGSLTATSVLWEPDYC